MLQQYLPFTVLKRSIFLIGISTVSSTVATVLTVYGIETNTIRIVFFDHIMLQQYLPFTVLKLFSVA